MFNSHNHIEKTKNRFKCFFRFFYRRKYNGKLNKQNIAN